MLLLYKNINVVKTRDYSSKSYPKTISVYKCLFIIILIASYAESIIFLSNFVSIFHKS